MHPRGTVQRWIKAVWEGVYEKFLSSDSFTVAMALLVAPLNIMAEMDSADIATYRRHVTRAAQRLAELSGFGEDVAEEVVREVNGLFQGNIVTPMLARKATTLQAWWNLAQDEAPVLFKLFGNLSCTAASEAESERIFSLIGITHTDLRNRMLTETLEALVLVSRLHSWKKWFGVATVFPNLCTPPEPIPNHPEVHLRAFGVLAAQILLGTDSRVSSVKRSKGLKVNDRIKVWFANHGGATEYSLRVKSTDDKWVLKKGAHENIFDPTVDDWLKI